MKAPSRRRPRQLGLVVAACVLVAVAVPSAATAAGVIDIDVTGGTAEFLPGDGVANSLTVTSAAGTVTFTDTADIIVTAEPSCTGSGTNTVTCTGPDLTDWEANLGVLDDRLVASGTLVGAVSGDGGSDILTGGSAGEYFSGGEGLDTITGNGGNDTAIDFGVGADTISLGGGSDTLLGLGAGTVANLGPDSDTFQFVAGIAGSGTVEGSTGTDRVEGFPDVQAPLTVHLTAGTIAEKAPPGAPDSIKSFEDVGGTLVGGDSITGTAGANNIRTGFAPGFLIVLGPLVLPNGNDIVNPLEGSDSVDTGDGADSITTVDGYADRVNCGPGADTVAVDQFDTLDACENVTIQQRRAALADLRAPACAFTKASRKSSRKAFLRGYIARFRCDEQVTASSRIVVAAKRRRGEVVLAKTGDVILAERSTQAAPDVPASLSLKPSRRIAKALPRKFTARVVIEARDEFGNRKVLTRNVKVTTPPKKKPRKRR